MRIRAVLLATFVSAACGLAGDLPKPSDIPPLIKQLTAGNAKARTEAAREIGEIGLIKASYAKPAIPALMKAAESDKDPAVREAALIALGQVDPDARQTMPTFLSALKDSSDEVKTGAALGVSHLGGDARDALPELRKIREELNKRDQKERAKKGRLMQAVNEAMQTIQSSPKRPPKK